MPSMDSRADFGQRVGMSGAGNKAADPKDMNGPLLLYLIKNVQLKSSMLLGAALEPFGVTAVQFRVLAEINQHKNMSSAALSRLFDVRPQTMNKQIAQLEALGLIARTVSAQNQRVLEMSLTAAGRRTLRECYDEALKLEQELFGSFSKTRRDDFRACLLELLRRMDRD